MTVDYCATCNRLSKYYDDCLASIQRLKDLARTAQESNDHANMDSLLETARSLQSEASELLVALTEHKNRSHPAGTQ